MKIQALFPLVFLKRFLERRSKNVPQSDIREVNLAVNAILLLIMRLEARILMFVHLSQGVSLICLGRK